jgi:hypothetical protein
VYAFEARDADAGAAGDVEYALTYQSCAPPPRFAVTATNGRLTIANVLDYETVKSCSMIVTARDRGDTPQTSTAHVLVYIQGSCAHVSFIARQFSLLRTRICAALHA